MCKFGVKIVYIDTYTHSFAKVKKFLSFSNEIELYQSISINYHDCTYNFMINILSKQKPYSSLYEESYETPNYTELLC